MQMSHVLDFQTRFFNHIDFHIVLQYEECGILISVRKQKAVIHHQNIFIVPFQKIRIFPADLRINHLAVYLGRYQRNMFFEIIQLILIQRSGDFLSKYCLNPTKFPPSIIAAVESFFCSFLIRIISARSSAT